MTPDDTGEFLLLSPQEKAALDTPRDKWPMEWASDLWERTQKRQIILHASDIGGIPVAERNKWRAERYDHLRLLAVLEIQLEPYAPEPQTRAEETAIVEEAEEILKDQFGDR